VARERDLVAALRAELAAVEPARACCRRAERAGLGAAATGRARTPGIARLAVRLEEPSAAEVPFAWDRAADHCRVAWLRGRFLAAGSLSVAPGRTHLELVVPVDEAPELVARMAGLGLPASWRIRRGRGVVSVKRRQTVLDLLRRAGASAAALELELADVTAALRGHLNRVVNADAANVARSVAAADRQCQAIEALLASGRLDGEPRHVQDVALLRRSVPEASITDLAATLGASRPRVQRALERIEALAERTEAAARGADVG
jgi:DNA-binding protein WhiA